MSQETCLKVLKKTKKPTTAKEVALLGNLSVSRANFILNRLCEHPFPDAKKIYLRAKTGNHAPRVAYISI